jgi:hypothetical protein
MRKSNRMISVGTVIAMLIAAPVMAQTAATTGGTGLAPAGGTGTSGVAGLSVGTLAAIGAGAIAIAAIAVAVSSDGNNAPVTTTTAVGTAS